MAARHEERSRLDPIGDDREFHAVQARRSGDADDRLAGAADLRAHGAQGRAEVGDLRLAGGVLDDRLALGERGDHHQVLGGADRRHVEVDAGAAEAVDGGLGVAVRDIDDRTELAQAVDVQVHRPAADGAAAGQRDARLAEAREQRPEHEERGAHRLHEIVRCLVAVDAGGADASTARPALDRRAEILEQTQRRPHVDDVGQVAHLARFVGEQRREEDRQRGVLRPRDRHLTLQPPSAPHQDGIHQPPLPVPRPCATSRRGIPARSGSTRTWNPTAVASACTASA